MKHSIGIYSFLILLIVSALSCKQQSDVARRNSIVELQDKLEQSYGKDVMVIAHRGDWRNAPENSIQAIENCIKMGVDMVEIDIRMTKDSQLVVIHDKTLDRTTTGKGKVSDWTLDSLKTLYLKNGANHATHHRIPTLEEAMLAGKDKILINLDKCYGYFDKAYEILQKTGTINQVVMKGKVPAEQAQKEFGEYLNKVYFMPIVDLGEPHAQQTIEQYLNTLQPIAIEFVFEDEKSPVLNEFNNIRKRGSRIWVNSLWESLNAGYEDDMALENEDKVYGWLIERGVNMIQTDRPKLLLTYLRKHGLHE